MGANARALAWQRRGVIVEAMPQRPRNFEIAHVATEPAERAAMVSTGPGLAAPSRFMAYVQLAIPSLRLTLAIIVTSGGLPIVDYVTIWGNGQDPLSSGLLRKVLLDPIIRAAVAEASVPVTDRPDVAPGAFHVDGEPEEQLWVSTPAGATERVQQIARLYNEALTAGSRSPGLEAANAVHISRAQAARYIKRARDLGLIPPVGEVTGTARPALDDVPVQPAEKWDPGPAPFRDPAEPWPGSPAKER